MKITEIIGSNRLRDFKICYLWQEGLKTNQEIADIMGVSARLVTRVVYKNRAVLKSDKFWEKANRIKWLKEQLEKSGDTKKDPLEIQEQIRKEIEGDGNATSINQPVIQIINYGTANNSSGREIPTGTDRVSEASITRF